MMIDGENQCAYGRYMAVDESKPFEDLDHDECWRLLRTSSVGRLAVSVAGMPDIFPVNYVVADERLLFRTAPGNKLVQIAINEQVALQADEVLTDEVWSIVVKGTARILLKQSEIDAADELSLTPMLGTLKYTFVEITPTETTGIRFVPGPEPERF